MQADKAPKKVVGHYRLLNQNLGHGGKKFGNHSAEPFLKLEISGSYDIFRESVM